MENKLVRSGVLLGIGINIVILVCMYYLEYRVGLLESKHPAKVCYHHK